MTGAFNVCGVMVFVLHVAATIKMLKFSYSVKVKGFWLVTFTSTRWKQIPNIFEILLRPGAINILPVGESNPGLPRDRRRYSPLYYRGWGTFWEQNSLLDSLLLPTTISRWIYRFSSDHRSQAASSLVSTWMGDRLGIPSVVGIFW